MIIRRLGPSDLEDFTLLLDIFRDVFDHDDFLPEKSYLARMLGNSSFIVFVAEIGGNVVGGLTMYTLHHYTSVKPLLYIYDVGVAAAHQGRGIGKELINSVCDFCRSNGYYAAFVQAEADDTDAVSFYRKTGYTSEMNAIQFTYSFN